MGGGGGGEIESSKQTSDGYVHCASCFVQFSLNLILCSCQCLQMPVPACICQCMQVSVHACVCQMSAYASVCACVCQCLQVPVHACVCQCRQV